MTKDELIERLNELGEAERASGRPDAEVTHLEADEALLDYIGDAEITEAFMALNRWYA